MASTEEELIKVRAEHGQALESLGSKAFPNTFRETAEMRAARKALVALTKDDAKRAQLPGEADTKPTDPRIPLYGRVVAKRGPFLVIRTPHGDVQSLVRPEALSDNDRAQLELLDLADHAYVAGPAMKTGTGALAVKAFEYRHLGKAMRPPPDKWHGLTDVEKRYRERYVDLFANPDVAEVFRARTTIVSALRSYFDGHGFVEVETPLLHSVRGGATARPFRTHHNTLDMGLFLRIAPELYLKRLLVGGLERVYEIGRCFRNEGVSTRHNPEFTMLEFYQAYATYEDLMDLTVDLLRSVNRTLTEKHPTLASARTFDLDAEWKRVTMRQAICDRLERSGQGDIKKTPWTDKIDRRVLDDPPRLATACEEMIAGKTSPAEKKQLAGCMNHGERIFLLYELLAEPVLTQLYRTPDGSKSVPVFITEYPFEVSPLARKNDEDPAWVDRFELFIDGKEVANAFSELNDPDDQASRFHAQLEKAKTGDEETMDYDADYIRALSHGMPPAAGFGMGVDRLTLLICGQPSIRDVLLFPLMRPEGE